MNKYIDAEWLKELYKPYENFEGKMYSVPVGAILANIDDAPSIDIVSCKDCKLGGTEDCPMDEIDDEYFCNFGVRNRSEKPNNYRGLLDS